MRRALTTAGLAIAGLGLAAFPASAHVTVNPNSATQGGYATLTFKVPTERTDASTTALEVDFPPDQPLTGASYQPKPGWKIDVTKEPLTTPITTADGQVTDRVSKIVWTADTDSARIAPGQFDTFPISVGPLPTADQMVFKALQTYSSGEIVRWIEEVAAGSTAEPAHPAPVLTLTPAGASTTESAAPADTAKIDDAKATADEAKSLALEAKTAASESSNGPSNGQVNAAIGLGIAGIVLALIAGGIAGMALGRRSNSPGGGVPPAF
jgi:uncharacterized protein YcnI